MDQPVGSDARLEVSVSFGRFENDALCWEKWSSFSPNKYLEEAGSLSARGSVAKKKAYFEAHYKKIAAQKAAEALEQEKAVSPDVRNHDVLSKEAFTDDSSEVSNESEGSNAANLIEENLGDFCFSISCDEGVNEEADDDVKAVVSSERVDGAIALNDGSGSVVEGAVNELNGDVHLSMTDAESDTVEFRRECSAALEKPGAMKGKNYESKNSVSLAQNGTGTKKKVASTATKQVQASMNSEKPIASAPQSLKKKGTSEAKNKKFPVLESKRRLAPTSLHMSLNPGSPNSLSNPSSTMKKSSIMEKMGNKEIVRRAFKTFQKRDNASSSSAPKPSPVKHVSGSALSCLQESSASVKPKISIPQTPVKAHERLSASSSRDSDKRTTPRSNPLPSGSHKKYPIGLTTRTLTNDEKAAKRKEFLKKLEANSIARAAERTSKVVAADEKLHPSASNR